MPHKRIVNPAIACINRSKDNLGSSLIPYTEVITTLIIVKIVTLPKVIVTSTRDDRLAFAAGYMSIGIRGSHGPKRKIIINIQGVNSL